MTSAKTNATPKKLHFRKATVSDIPFLARIEYEASLPPLNYCFWDDILQGTQTESLEFVEVALKADAFSWGGVADFLVLEENDRPVAAAAGFTPNSEDYRPLRLSRLDAIAQLLGWSLETTTVFRKRYDEFWGDDRQPVFLKPQAPWIVENVAVLPEARGRGLGKVLLRGLLEEGRSQQHSHAGIMVIHGNNIAQHTYESIGFKPYQSFYADYFDDRFSGLTKFRLCLNEDVN